MIPYGKQNISASDIDSVIDVLKSDFLTQGPKTPEFEKALCDITNSQFGFATNSATSALHVACMALELGQGDLVWTTPITFVASANCALYCQAEVDFVDVEPDTTNLCPIALEQKLIAAKAHNRLPKALIAVHFAGLSCDMKAIKKLADDYGFSIIEDASHAIGGQYQGQPIGNCQYSDMTVFSFHPVKIVTSAEGGLITTNDPHLAKKVNLYRNHGVTRDRDLMTNQRDEPWYYEQIALGYNYRMTELQAALGLNQLQNLSLWVEQRNQLRQRYDEAFSQVPEVTVNKITEGNVSACHLYVIKVPAGKRTALFHHLRAQKIGVNVHYIPVYHQPYYKQLEQEFSPCMNAEAYYQSTISIPLHPGLTQQDQDYIVECVKGGLCNLD